MDGVANDDYGWTGREFERDLIIMTGTGVYVL